MPKMQKELDSLRTKGGEEISKQLEKLVLGSVGNYNETESESEIDEASSCGDETDAFEGSLEFENDLGKLGGWRAGELSLESDEEAALNDETQSAASDESSEEQSSSEPELPTDRPGISTVGISTMDSMPGSSTPSLFESQNLLKLKELQTEIDNLKEIIEEFAKSTKSSLTEIIYEQFSQLEGELFELRKAI